ncbi:50S ribosomal protein L11 methyltransferase [Geobacter argillaceus]|uniref:[LSU ribosomal protein L11P]-lysine N-methyltransferase n=1 Tax=Geobacter argillaceus TaxID=345631 RepID=A0A562V8V6_9BACT|nr:50S ribosomal protein L11 methyltransferase [Geobacter argillaceus]TWJ14336.1 [LSU ribosomal protein L11P]-lysine N-methyltransferase [Geobacter argillaceus]
MSGRIFEPSTIGGFTIVPEGAPAPDNGIPLFLGKRGAFGSGEHETTASCLEVMRSLPGVAGARVLDLGSGTGILAIASAKLQAASVVAIDLDWRAATSCHDNVRINREERRVLTVCGELACLANHQFDLILANIYADILLAVADQLVSLTRPGGSILLSGIPLQDKYDIWRRYDNQGCELVNSRIMEEYVTYLWRKR